MNPPTREWMPDRPAKGVFLLLHGMESHSGWFSRFAPLLAESRYAAIAFDRPGCGQAPGVRGHLESYRDLLEHVSGLVAEARKKYGPVHLAGMSWGGMAALYTGLRRPWLFSSITLLAPGLATRRDIGFAGKVRTAAAFLSRRAAADPLPLPFQPRHFTHNEEWQRFIADDADKNSVVTTGFCIETVKMRRFIAESAGKRRLPPALCLLAEDDAIVDNPATRALAERAGAQVATVAGAAHTLVFDNPAETAERMIRHADAAATATGNTWILGGGAVGGTLAALLGHGGDNVSVLVKREYLGRYRANGITLRSGQGERTASGLTYASIPKELPPNPELVVVAVKSFDTPRLLASIQPHIPARAVIASIQNGVENEEALVAAFPHNTLVAASILAGLEMTSPGCVVWPDDRGGIAAALHHGDAGLAKSVWQSVMQKTGFETAWITGDKASARLKWSKLMLNIGFNALAAVTGLASAELLSRPDCAFLAIAAMREGFSVMKKQGLQPVDLPGYPVSKLRRIVGLPLPIARKVLSWQAGRNPEAMFSMRQDMVKNRKNTEIDALNAKIVELGDIFGVTVNANRTLTAMTKMGKTAKPRFCSK